MKKNKLYGLFNTNLLKINKITNTNNNNNYKQNKNNFLTIKVINNLNQYNIIIIKQYIEFTQYIISNHINKPLYISSKFITSLFPETIKLSVGAQRILNEDNAGGESELSEAFSFEILNKCFKKVKLLKSEMEIKYLFNHCKITDYLIEMNNNYKIGVSVTRAMKHNGLFNKYDGMQLLTKKINGINESSVCVAECDKWQRQILHIWTTDNYISNILYQTFNKLMIINPKFINNTIIFVTVASQEMWWIFYQDKYMNNNKKKKKKKKRKKKKKKKKKKKNKNKIKYWKKLKKKFLNYNDDLFPFLIIVMLFYVVLLFMNC